ncbi:GNAT family N-acetyltransferase [Butyrivibrio sp. XPD2002]|uniref:GNAT family N-acetyltransferase n=1 Tax=Butyrivibrio sp. XPD2002 TaxID=1280665 RepID=UPI00055EA49D|nr:GNAT family N-acetyltransferase [Butyrivibrio sp. XPD2002]
MIDYRIIFKKTSELLNEESDMIISLKQQHWGYSYEEQKVWLDNNILPDDSHLLIFKGGVLVAYLNAINVNVSINKYLHRMLGIGNVCVRKEFTHLGAGTVLMSFMNSLIKEFERPGILLCKEELVSFYKQTSWIEVFSSETFVVDQLFKHKVMLYDPNNMVILKRPMVIELSRNF